VSSSPEISKEGRKREGTRDIKTQDKVDSARLRPLREAPVGREEEEKGGPPNSPKNPIRRAPNGFLLVWKMGRRGPKGKGRGWTTTQEGGKRED